MEKLDFLCISGGDVRWYSYYRKQCDRFKNKTKIGISLYITKIIESIVSISLYIAKKIESMISKRHLYIADQSSSIHDT